MIFREYRIKLGLTQQQVADLADLGYRTIQRVENGELTPTLQTLGKLINVLHITDDDIIDYIKSFVDIRNKNKLVVPN